MPHCTQRDASMMACWIGKAVDDFVEILDAFTQAPLLRHGLAFEIDQVGIFTLCPALDVMFDRECRSGRAG